MEIAKNDISLNDENSNSKVYELGYLLIPSIKEEDLNLIYGNLKELISSFGGDIISDDIPKFMPLAYMMRKVISNVNYKFNTAYFGWVKFYMDSAKILELKKTLDLDSNFLRFLILKTVKENTIASKRFIHKDMYKKISNTKKNTNEDVFINKEEIDKEIDALITT